MSRFNLLLSPKEAAVQQKQLATRVDLSKMSGNPALIGGCDISYNRFSAECFSAIVILDYETMEVVASSSVRDEMTFPYVPGLLSYRELPSIMKCWEQLTVRPDVVACDGQGFAHPRRLGIASHFGLLANVAAFGIAKSVLLGLFEGPDLVKGSFSAMTDKDELVGYALRTKNKVKPVYISSGTGMSHEDARKIALHCARGYRIPEPTRQAHLLVNRLRRGEEKVGMRIY
ncbi:MAG: endonuclease V [Bacteroidota bacterium]